MKALITGIGGQDGAYLTRFLRGKGYEIHGTVNHGPHQFDNLVTLEVRDAVDLVLGAPSGDKKGVNLSIRNWIHDHQYDEIYNLAAHSSVADSFTNPRRAHQSSHDFIGILDAVRDQSPHTRIFQASSSEMFGVSGCMNESSSLRPMSPYGVSKAYAHHMARIYRDGHNVWVACGILFNHESILRKKAFVMRKITAYAARIAVGMDLPPLVLSAPGVRRDWGWAGDYVEAMWTMLQADDPRDYVIATGDIHTVLDIARLCAGRIGVNLDDLVSTEPSSNMDRPLDVPCISGQTANLHAYLGWQAHTQFEELVDKLLTHDIQAVHAEHG